MEEFTPKVLYETRHHAKRPFVSRYPPQKQDDGVKGGLLSLLPVPGINQLREKWEKYRHPIQLKRWISLFVSPSGEHVAVAARNQIIILQKNDDYQDPCGIFNSDDRLPTFTHGAWLDYHDFLAAVDDSNTLYFIRANGEEIARIAKKQLKALAPIVGLIVQGDADAETSRMSRFCVVTSDGLLHQIEVVLGPMALVPSLVTLNTHLILQKQFPRKISCLDYCQELSLLVVVGTASSDGFYSLSLWRMTSNLDVEPVFCGARFEGVFSKPKDYEGTQITPKVILSPQSKHVAALDLTGGLFVFDLDDEYRSLSIIDFRESSSSLSNGLSNMKRKCLNDVADFTWWSNGILVIAKMSGVVTMVDVHTGKELMNNNLVFSMPVLERVQHRRGCIFLLQTTSSEERDPQLSSQAIDMLLHGRDGEDRSYQSDISKLSWSLLSLSEKSVEEMYKILINNEQYQDAMGFANCHGLDRDEILKSQWLNSAQGTNDVNMFLSKIKDEVFALSECVEKVGPTEEAVKALLAYGLHITDKYRFLESTDGECSKTWDFRMIRLQLLQYRDRLETFVGVNMGRFSVQEYSKFRIAPLNEAAVTLAESGKIGALNLLFKRHPYSLAPFMLDVLAAIPETVPIQTYGQLLPGRSPPTTIALRDEDWVECEKMVTFIEKLPKTHMNSICVRTESILKQSLGFVWPSVDELSLWYKNRAMDIDTLSGQMDNCLCLLEFACRKGIVELQQFHQSISYLYQLIYSEVTNDEVNITMSLATWERLSDYEKFKMMLDRVKDDKVVEILREKAIPFMLSCSGNHNQTESFLVRWLKEVASDNKLDICLTVIEDGCRDFHVDGIFRDEVQAVGCAVQCVYLCTLTDRWNMMASILSKLPQIKDDDDCVENLEKKVKVAEGHVEAGRLLAYYQVPKPMGFFLEAHSDQKGVKQILRLILSKFGRRQPGRSDNDWANMWRDMQLFQDKAFPFLDLEYMLTEFCRGLLKSGKFSLARNYLKGTGTISLATEKAENLVIQAAREYFFSASSLACSEIWKAKECLNIFPNSKNVKAEADIIDALTNKLPNLGVTLLPMQFRQIRDPMEIINMVITSQTGAYVNVDELIEIAKLLGLSSPDDIAAVQEAVAREAAVTGDLQLAFDLCLVLAKKGHGPIWDLCAAIARGPALDNIDVSSRKHLLGFALSHCDEESIPELLHAWKDLDIQGQCETLMMLTGTSPPNISIQGSSIISLPGHSVQDIASLANCSDIAEGMGGDQEIHFRNIKNIISEVAKDLSVKNESNWDSLLRENGKVLSFSALQLPWLLELSRKTECGKWISGTKSPNGNQWLSVKTQAVVAILSWLARNNIAPSDHLIASLAKSVMEIPATEEEDILGFAILLNLADAFHGVEVIEEQLKAREGYNEICSVMNMGLAYSSLHNFSSDRGSPTMRRELLLQKFQDKHAPFSSDAIDKIDKVHSTFWREWKSKLEEQKLFTDQSRALEQIIPGVDAARFLSGDSEYIESAVFSLFDLVKQEKKPSLKEVLKWANTYGLNQSEVVLRYLTSVLVSEVWANDDIIAAFSEHKKELVSSSAQVITTISSDVYPVIDGCNKQRLAYIFSILSDCYSHLNKTNDPLFVLHSDPAHSFTLELPQFYEVLHQECRRISFIKNLNFKNIAGLGGLNVKCFNSEVYSNIDEFSVEALAKMVQNLVSIYTDPTAEGLMSWQAVYKHYILSSLTYLVPGSDIHIKFRDQGDFQRFISELEQNYDCVRIYIRALSHHDVVDIVKKYCTSSVPLDVSSESLPDEPACLECLVPVLKFWVKLSDDMQEIVSSDSSEETAIKFSLESLSICLKVFLNLVTQEKVSASQGWAIVSEYVKYILDGFIAEASKFCRAMVFSGCGFEAIYEVFSKSVYQKPSSLSVGVDGSGNVDGIHQNLPHLYVDILDAVLADIAKKSDERQILFNLLSTLSKLEGDLEDLKRVRYVVWGKLSLFSENMQLKSHIRVFALELMQSITGRNLKGLPPELLSNVHSWEGWDELHRTSSDAGSANQGAPNQLDASNRFTSTLVALKSTRLAAGISPNLEISPDDLLTLDSALPCFLNLCGAADTPAHLETLQAILEEWEGLFSGTTTMKEEDPGEASDAGKNWSSGDEWDEGWESFQEEPLPEKEGKQGPVLVHPLHLCWMEIIKKLISLSQFMHILELIDRSFAKPNMVLLDQDDAQRLAQLVVSIDCFAALKMVLLLPYQPIQLQCLDTLEGKLKQGGLPGAVRTDHDLLTLILSSGVMSIIITNSTYSTTFSYLCYLAGHYSRLCQETHLSRINSTRTEESKTDDDNFFILFKTTLFPCFISELVKARQPLLAGFVISRFMHTHTSLSLVNVVHACLRRYLESQIRSQQTDLPLVCETGMCKYLGNTISSLRGKLGQLLQSALASLSDTVK